jgi:aminoglycoside phosphotransferase (APT) family kinase protein
MSPAQPMSVELLSRGLAANVPGCGEVVACERLSGGANQETYRVVTRTASGTRQYAVRRSLGGLSAAALSGYAGLRAEALLMRAARTAGVPEPEVYWIFESSAGLGDGFVMEWLDGETLGKRVVGAESLADVRPKLAFQCGEILARIHAIDLGAAGLENVLSSLPPATYLEQTYARYRGFDAPQPMIDYTARWLRGHLPKAARLGLVHNDFRNGNLMISPAGVIAVLDWELAHIGDPMRDLGWICTNSWRFGGSDLPVGGFGTYEDLFRGYESVSGQPVDRDRVRYWEVFGSFWWAIGCLEMANAYRTGLDPGIERAAIGRRTSECQVDCVNHLIPGPVELLAPSAAPASVDMPRTDELVRAARDFLRDDVMSATTGRTRFLARVAANALDIAARDSAVGDLHRARQRERLRRLLAVDGDLPSLCRKVAERLRDGSMPLDHPGLADYLRESVVNQVAIDQPRYSGLRTALANAMRADASDP